MSDRLRRIDIEALIRDPVEGVFLCAELRAEFRSWRYWRAKRKLDRSRPFDNRGEI